MSARLIRQASVLLLLTLLLTDPIPARAAVYTWNAGSGNTNASVNWSPAGLPGPNDDTRFWQSGIIYAITTVSPIDTFATLSASSASTLKFFGDDPIRVRNAFQVDGGVTASILSGMARAGWFTVGVGTLAISGNGVQAISTNPAAFDYVGTASGFTSTLNVGGGASFNGFNIQVPQIQGATGILSVAGHVLGGPSSSLHTVNAGSTGDLDIGRQGTGDGELSASASIKVDRSLELGLGGAGKLHLWRGVGTGQGPASLVVAGSTYIGDNEVAGTPGGQGTLAIDVGSVTCAGKVYMGDANGGSPDTLRMLGGSLVAEKGLIQEVFSHPVIDLQGGSLRIVGRNGAAMEVSQYTPLTIDGAGAGPTLTFYGDDIYNYINTVSPTSLIVGRSGAGTLNVVGVGHDIVYVNGSAIVADSITATGVVNADSLGELQVNLDLAIGPGNGVVRARGGGRIYDTRTTTVLAGAATAGSLVIDGYNSTGDFQHLDIGGNADAGTPGAASVWVQNHGAATIERSALIWGNGGNLQVTNAATVHVDTLDCRGEIHLAQGTIFSNLINADLHLTHGGRLHGGGTVISALWLDDATDTLGVFATDLPTDSLWVMPNSTFSSAGTLRVDQGVLAFAGSAPVPTGHVLLQGGTLYLPGAGGRLRPGDVLEGAGRIDGNLTNDGLVNATGTINVAGHLSVGTGEITGTGLNVLSGGELSAHGVLSGLLTLGGRCDMGPSLAKLEFKRGPIMQPSAVLSLRIGSKAHGAQDTLAVDDGLTLAGTLDLRTWQADPSVVGDTLTLITAPFVQGTFAAVTIDGVNAASYVEAIYGPTTVRVVVHQPTTDVPPPPLAAGGAKLRFAAEGTLRDPWLALDLPERAQVEVSIYSAAGRRLAQLERGPLEPGKYRFPIGGGPGVYFARAWVSDATGRHQLAARAVRVP